MSNSYYEIQDKTDRKYQVDNNVDTVVSLWNQNVKHLPNVNVKYLSKNIKDTICNAYEYYGIETVKECFQKIDNSKFLLGFSDSKFRATIGWVCDLDNMSKILNHCYDDELDLHKPKEIDAISFHAKCVYYRLMQEKGWKDTDTEETRIFDEDNNPIFDEKTGEPKTKTLLVFDEKMIFTDEERKYWDDQDRIIGGKFISVPVDADTPKSNEFWLKSVK